MSGHVYLLVTVTFSLNFPEDVDAIIIAQRPAHLVVVHREVVFLDAPESSQSGRIDNFEHPGLSILPRYVICVPLRRVVEQLLQKVPQ